MDPTRRRQDRKQEVKVRGRPDQKETGQKTGSKGRRWTGPRKKQDRKQEVKVGCGPDPEGNRTGNRE